MLSMEERAQERRKKSTLTKVGLHDKAHHSFHLHLNTEQAWELLARLSKESWIAETGEIPPERVNKSICRLIVKKSR